MMDCYVRTTAASKVFDKIVVGVASGPHSQMKWPCQKIFQATFVPVTQDVTRPWPSPITILSQDIVRPSLSLSISLSFFLSSTLSQTFTAHCIISFLSLSLALSHAYIVSFSLFVFSDYCSKYFLLWILAKKIDSTLTYFKVLQVPSTKYSFA